MSFDLQQYLKELEYLVSLDTGKFNRPGVEKACEFFEEKFRTLPGVTVEWVWDGDEQYAPMVVARNCSGEQYDVMFVAHLDTVFPVGTAAERHMTIDENGIAHGPGVEDCKSGALSIYYLIANMIEAGECNYRFCAILNCDEETGSRHSEAFIRSVAQKCGYCFVHEPGRANDDFVNKRRGGVSFDIHFHGIAAHSGSSPEKGASAILEMSKWVVELEKLNNFEKGVNVNCAICSGGKTSNIIPEFAELKVSCRLYTQEDLDMLRKAVHDLEASPFDSRVKVTVDDKGGRLGMLPSAQTLALMERMKAVGERMNYKFDFVASGGGSDANECAEYLPTICACGPSGFCAHTVDEYIRVDSIEPRLAYMRALMLELFGK